MCLHIYFYLLLHNYNRQLFPVLKHTKKMLWFIFIQIPSIFRIDLSHIIVSLSLHASDVGMTSLNLLGEIPM
jgi:hypothetical protein